MQKAERLTPQKDWQFWLKLSAALEGIRQSKPFSVKSYRTIGGHNAVDVYVDDTLIAHQPESTFPDDVTITKVMLALG